MDLYLYLYLLEALISDSGFDDTKPETVISLLTNHLISFVTSTKELTAGSRLVLVTPSGVS